MSCRWTGLRACVCALAVAWLPSQAARAQESPPYAYGLVFAAGDPVPRMVLARSAGLVVRVDARDAWELLCSRAVGLSSGMTPKVYAADDGGFVLASLFGAQRGDATACDWQPAGAPLDATGVQSLVRHEGTLFALTSANGANGLYESDDEGASWSERLEVADGSFYRSLLVAPTRVERMYFHVVYANADSGTVVNTVAVSDDGGATRVDQEIDGDGTFDLLTVDPADPDRVYASRTYSSEGHSHGDAPAVPPDQLLVSDDAGASWRVLTEVTRFGGFAIASGSMWLGNGEGGLLRSTDGGESFETLDDGPHVGCLAVHEGKLYACAQAMADGFSVGVSDDDGATFAPVVRFDEVVAQLQCGDVLDVEASCGVFWSGWQFWHQGAAPDAGTDASIPPHSIATGDASTEADASTQAAGADDDGCGCRAAGADARGRPAALTSLVLLLGLRPHGRRRRRLRRG